MSGGSHDYFHERVDQFIDSLTEYETTNGLPPLRAAFVERLRLLSVAAKAVERVDSSDWAAGLEIEPIRAFLDGSTPRLGVTRREMDATLESLRGVDERVRKHREHALSKLFCGGGQ